MTGFTTRLAFVKARGNRGIGVNSAEKPFRLVGVTDSTKLVTNIGFLSPGAGSEKSREH